MNRRDFTSKATLGILGVPVLSKDWTNEQLFNLKTANPKVPLGMDAHAISMMRWKAQQLMEYAIDLNMDSILFNALSYFDNLEEEYLKALRNLLETNNMSLYFGVGSLSVNSLSYTPIHKAGIIYFQVKAK